MLSLLLRPLLLLITLSATLITFLHSQPYDAADLRALLLPPPDCLCWQGIEIGVTTRAEATRILEANPWVAQVFQTNLAVTWRWNGQQPPLFNTAKDGLLQISGNVVSQIRIQTLIPFGDVWLMLAQPDDVRLVQPLTRSGGYQIASYNAGIRIISTLDCPATPMRFWAASITLGMGEIWSTEALNSRSFNIYRTPHWWSRLHQC